MSPELEHLDRLNAARYAYLRDSVSEHCRRILTDMAGDPLACATEIDEAVDEGIRIEYPKRAAALGLTRDLGLPKVTP